MRVYFPDIQTAGVDCATGLFVNEDTSVAKCPEGSRMEGFAQGVLERLGRSCGAVCADLELLVDTGRDKVRLTACSWKKTTDNAGAFHSQMDLFPGFPGSADLHFRGELPEGPDHGESRSREGPPEVSITMGQDMILGKLGDDLWRITGRRSSIELEIIIRFEKVLDGEIIGALDAAVPFIELLLNYIPYDAGSAAASEPITHREDEEPRFDPPMYGASKAIAELREKICRLARARVPVLIEGENGTGKEIVARNIHNAGPRSGRPLVIVNCMEMPESMLQGELFGHVRGAFTGAMYDRKGLMEGAAGGTFFFDEIGELPLTLQASLLRVIQEKEIRRIGESERRRVDVRFVFATNRELSELVKNGSFRQDLYYRIRGVRLSLPPLRERRIDIMPLARRFLLAASRSAGRSAPGMSSETVKRLVSHDWPGNVRELRNEMERVIALYPSAAMVSPGMLSSTISSAPFTASPCSGLSDHVTMPEAVMRLEKQMIGEALERFDSNRTRSAEYLGITRQGLLKKLKRYRLVDQTVR